MITAILIGLTAYRLWRLFALDTLTEGLRDRLSEHSLLYTFVTCPWCLGTWLTMLIWGITWRVSNEPMEYPGLVLGAASIVCATFGTVDKWWSER